MSPMPAPCTTLTSRTGRWRLAAAVIGAVALGMVVGWHATVHSVGTGATAARPRLTASTVPAGTRMYGINANNDMLLFVSDASGHLTYVMQAWPGSGAWAGYHGITSADFNADGLPDVAGINSYNDLLLFLGSPSGQLTYAGMMWPGSGQWAGYHGIAAADYNLDGTADIAGVNSYNDMVIFPGNSTGHLDIATAHGAWPSGGQWANYHGIAGSSRTPACTGTRGVLWPLGDSITNGEVHTTGGDGYRAPLADLIDQTTPMGCRWQYEGSLQSGSRWYSHDGRSGETINQVATHVPASLAAMQPAGQPVSTVLLDAGTNDSGQDHTVPQMTADMGALLDRILAASPTVRVLVAQITISTGLTPARQQAESGFDDSLPALAQARGPRVAVVDMRGVPLGSDGVHPDDLGAQDMAGRWHTALGASGWLP